MLKFLSKSVLALIAMSSSIFAAPTADVLTRIQQLYEKAEEAVRKQNAPTALETYNQLLKLAEIHTLDDSFVADISLKLATLYHALHDYTKEQLILNKVLSKSLSDPLLLRCVIQQAYLYTEQNMDKEAYLLMHNLEKKIPMSNWTTSDRQLFTDLREKLNSKYQRILVKAERQFDSGLYKEAAANYLEVLESARQGGYPEVYYTTSKSGEIVPQIRYRLAQAYFLNEEYDKVIQLLSKPEEPLSPYVTEASSKLSEIERNETYLLGLSYRQTKKYEAAIQTLKNYLRMGDQPLLEHYTDVQWELGLCYFYLGKYSQAQNCFEWMECNGEKNRSGSLARLYLARLSLAQNQIADTEKYLYKVEKELAPNDPLHLQIAYIRGEIAFRTTNYSSAIEQFEKALPKTCRLKSEWMQEALYHLGWSYLKMADDPLKIKNLQEFYFIKAEETFSTLLASSDTSQLMKEKSILSLGQTHLRKGLRLKDDNAYKEAEKILSEESMLTSLDALAQALLLRAEVAPNYETRLALYNRLTEEKFQCTSLSGQGWYQKALNDYEEAKKELTAGNSNSSTQLFTQSISHFGRAFEQLLLRDKKHAALSLKMQIEAYDALGNQEGTMKAFLLVKKLIEDYSDLISALPEPGEIFYMQGTLAFKLSQGPKSEFFNQVTENSLHEVVTQYPKGKFCEPALHFLGTYYFQQGKYLEAQQAFIKLAMRFPKSKISGEALFWAGECAEWLQQNPEVIQSYRKQVYELYPESPFAAESYFMVYSYTDYLQGGSEAIDHLLAMKSRFPLSPYVVISSYLLGLDYKRDRKSEEGNILRKKDLISAADAFEQSKRLFEECLQQQRLPSDKMEYFTTIYYEAQLERALSLLAIAEDSNGAKKQLYLDYAAQSFIAIRNDAQNPQHFLTSKLNKSESFASLIEECHFGLAQVYLKTKQEDAAEKVLTEMIEHYSKTSIKRGYFLSRAWYELGCISMNRNDFQLANQFFSHSEEASKGNLITAEQRLDLWIQQSLCHRALKDLDIAMTLLSRVINDNTASSLRLKAMYLRAEIYEEQGRHELAVKQLEAMSKKGGEWALKANEKLEQKNEYR